MSTRAELTEARTYLEGLEAEAAADREAEAQAQAERYEAERAEQAEQQRREQRAEEIRRTRSWLADAQRRAEAEKVERLRRRTERRLVAEGFFERAADAFRRHEANNATLTNAPGTYDIRRDAEDVIRERLGVTVPADVWRPTDDPRMAEVTIFGLTFTVTIDASYEVLDIHLSGVPGGPYEIKRLADVGGVLAQYPPKEVA